MGRWARKRSRARAYAPKTPTEIEIATAELAMMMLLNRALRKLANGLSPCAVKISW